MKTKVYPTGASSMAIKHPIDGQLKIEGSEWEVDGFTARMLVDRAITSNAEEAWKPAQSVSKSGLANSPRPTETGTETGAAGQTGIDDDTSR